jgi:penicillin amidase
VQGSLPLETLRRRLEPAHEPQVPKGLDPCLIGDDAMRTYTLATQEVGFDGVKLAVAAPETLALQDRAEQREGSNNWVVAPGHWPAGAPFWPMIRTARIRRPRCAMWWM